jgi:hypothetical protein
VSEQKPNLADLGPVDEWLINPEEIEQVAAGLCEHLRSVWECWPCLRDRLMAKQAEKIGSRWGLSPEDAAEFGRGYSAPAAQPKGDPT